MMCPQCGGETGVTDTRRMPGSEQYRRRKCKQCGEKYHTREFVVPEKYLHLPQEVVLSNNYQEILEVQQALLMLTKRLTDMTKGGGR